MARREKAAQETKKKSKNNITSNEGNRQFEGFKFSKKQTQRIEVEYISVSPEARCRAVWDGEVVFSFQDTFGFTRKRMRERIREKERENRG